MAGSAWNVFAPLTKIKSSTHNQNFEWIQGNIVPMSLGNTTDAAYDLGQTTARWRRGLYSDGIMVGQATTPSASLHVAQASSGADYIAGVFQNNAGANNTAVIVALTPSAVVTDRSVWLKAFNNGANICSLDILCSDGATPARRIRIAPGGVTLANGTNIDEFSTDGTLGGNSDLAVPTEKAVKTYVDGRIAVKPVTQVELGASGYSGTTIIDTIGNFFDTSGTTPLPSAITNINVDGQWTSTGYFTANTDCSILVNMQLTIIGENNNVYAFSATAGDLTLVIYGVKTTIGPTEATGSAHYISIQKPSTVATSVPPVTFSFHYTVDLASGQQFHLEYKPLSAATTFRNYSLLRSNGVLPQYSYLSIIKMQESV